MFDGLKVSDFENNADTPLVAFSKQLINTLRTVKDFNKPGNNEFIEISISSSDIALLNTGGVKGISTIQEMQELNNLIRDRSPAAAKRFDALQLGID